MPGVGWLFGGGIAELGAAAYFAVAWWRPPIAGDSAFSDCRLLLVAEVAVLAVGSLAVYGAEKRREELNLLVPRRGDLTLELWLVAGLAVGFYWFFVHAGRLAAVAFAYRASSIVVSAHRASRDVRAATFGIWEFLVPALLFMCAATVPFIVPLPAFGWLDGVVPGGMRPDRAPANWLPATGMFYFLFLAAAMWLRPRERGA